MPNVSIRRLPRALSCSHHTDFPASFRCQWPRFLIPRLMLGSGQVVRSKLGCKHELPVQPDYHVFSATVLLSPITEDTINRQ